MQNVTKQLLAVGTLNFGLALAPLPAAAADGYPARPVRVVVGFSPGGGADVVARIVTLKLTEVLKQNVFVENRPGAGGSIGAALVARSAPDGYTMMLVSSSYSVIPTLYKNLSFDAVKDFETVSLIAQAPLLVVVHPSLPVRSVRELVAFAKVRPGQLNYGSGGNGTSGYLAGELFKTLAGVSIVHVPYKGAGPALTDAVAGQVHMTFSSVLSALPHVKNQKLRAVAVTSAARSAVLPELPTVAEGGVKGYRRTTWYGMLAPARTLAAIVSAMSTAVQKSVGAPDVRQRFLSDGAEPGGGTPRQFHDYLVAEIAVAKQIVEKAGVAK
ncbi:MAG: tripartite tricarboxylate transporter substrate binding protein [Betaproteobacteria bacterium]|nr:tripartite tricarboxylate transporter substrate binding protein [Betaproteobacteria bacterium]